MGENIKGNLRRYAHRYSPLLVDMSLAILSMFLAFQIRFEGRVPQFWQKNMFQPLLVTALVRGIVNYFFNFYRQLHSCSVTYFDLSILYHRKAFMI